jgi:hypothetical protein
MGLRDRVQTWNPDALWPTATVGDHWTPSTDESAERETGKHNLRGTSITWRPDALWPTARAEDSESTGMHRWPTPDANVMNEGEGPQTFFKRQEELKAKGYNGNGCGIPLTIAATNWPTPASRDWRSEESLENREVQHAPNLSQYCYLRDLESSLPVPQTRAGPRFWSHYRILRRLCRQLRERLPSPYSKGGRFQNGKWQRAAMFRRKLSPDFVTWLMGLPHGWLDEETDSRNSAMRSYLSSARRHLESCEGA